QLAERAGCHPMTLAKLERGVHEPAWPLVLALAKALGVTVLSFVVEQGQEVTAPAPIIGRPPKHATEDADQQQPKPPPARRRKAPVATQDERSASKAIGAPSGRRRSPRGKGG